MHMRKLLLATATFFVAALQTSKAQTFVSTFDTLQLSGADTFYVNYSQPGQDVGFWDGVAYFPSVFDTSSFGPYWSSGFSYSNMTDTTTPGYLNDRSAITGKGYNNSSNYCVFWQGYEMPKIGLFSGVDTVQGFYVTNTTYAYLSMRDGDFVAKKFGGPTGNDPDWFKLTAYAFKNGAITDSADHYLADFRFTDNTQDFIQKDWQWVSLNFHNADSIGLQLTSSDVGAFGMNTPAYCIIDNFTMRLNPISVAAINQPAPVKLYPNPATDVLNIEAENLASIQVFDATGKLTATLSPTSATTLLNTSSWASGLYLLHITDIQGRKAVARFSKQ